MRSMYPSNNAMRLIIVVAALESDEVVTFGQSRVDPPAAIESSLGSDHTKAAKDKQLINRRIAA